MQQQHFMCLPSSCLGGGALSVIVRHTLHSCRGDANRGWDTLSKNSGLCYVDVSYVGKVIRYFGLSSDDVACKWSVREPYENSLKAGPKDHCDDNDKTVAARSVRLQDALSCSPVLIELTSTRIFGISLSREYASLFSLSVIMSFEPLA